MPTLPNHEILQELAGLMTGRWLTDLANTSALLFQHVPNINCVGFYLTEKTDRASDEVTKLWLGPFQGLPACTMIPFSKGVCGTAVPLIVHSNAIGALDVDSATVARFTLKDQEFFENVVATLLEKNKF